MTNRPDRASPESTKCLSAAAHPPDMSRFRGLSGAVARGTELAKSLRVPVLRKLFSLFVPATVAALAFFHASALGALATASIPPTEAVAPWVDRNAAPETAEERPTAAALVAHNPFEHAAPSPTVPSCGDVRVVFAVSAEHDDLSFAAIELAGKSFLRARGGMVGDLRVAGVNADRVVFERTDGSTCEAHVFAGSAVPKSPSPTIGGLPGIARLSPTSFEVDRSVIDHIFENQTELARTPLVPEKGGARLVRVNQGSVLAQLGFQSGDRLLSVNGMELSSPEKLLELYARVRGGGLGLVTVRVERGGKPIDIDFKVV
jgi:general secretion pathway protein C